MKEKFIRQVQHGMLGVLDQRQQEMLRAVLSRCLDSVEMTETISEKTSIADNARFLDMFVSAKRVEGSVSYTHLTLPTTP